MINDKVRVETSWTYFLAIASIHYCVCTAAMADFDAVPVVEIHSENLKQLWPTLILAVNSSTFVAIDAVSLSLRINGLALWTVSMFFQRDYHR